MQNIQKAAQLLQIPSALEFTNGRLVSTTEYKIRKIQITDFTQGLPPVVNISFVVDTVVTVAGVTPPLASLPNNSDYAFNVLSVFLATGGTRYSYTGETNGIHQVYQPHYEGIDNDPLSINYGLYHWENEGEILIEQTGPTEVTWEYRVEPGLNTYNFSNATPEHPVGSPTAPGDYSAICILMETTSQILNQSGLSPGTTYNEYVPIQEILDNSNWTIQDITENTRQVTVWDVDVDHDQYITSVAVDVSGLYSRGANSSVNCEVYFNGVIHTDIPYNTLTTAYYTLFQGGVKRWIHYNKHYQNDVNPGAWYVYSTGNTYEFADDASVILQYQDLNTIDWANQPSGFNSWINGFDPVTKIMPWSDDSRLQFEIEESPANSHNYAVGIRFDIATGQRVIS